MASGGLSGKHRCHALIGKSLDCFRWCLRSKESSVFLSKSNNKSHRASYVTEIQLSDSLKCLALSYKPVSDSSVVHTYHTTMIDRFTELYTHPHPPPYANILQSRESKHFPATYPHVWLSRCLHVQILKESMWRWHCLQSYRSMRRKTSA